MTKKKIILNNLSYLNKNVCTIKYKYDNITITVKIKVVYKNK